MDANTDFEIQLLILLAKELPEAKNAINSTFHTKNYEELHKHLHKLQGACVYCELPQLKSAVINLDNALKTNKPSINSQLLQQINYEIDNVMANLKAKKII